ncbi:MAG: polyprenyl synthetase family protein [Clostridia bacterium]|nr:polyprenyl synthetase family protein [Clostridia bacterium]
MQFEETLNKKVNEVNNIISAFLPKEETLAKTVIEAMNYSVNAGGKRIRPLIMQETFKMCGGTGSIAEPFMAAIEFIHTYSLVHDDLPAMDNDMYRRGKLTTHAKFGEDMGILAGDGLLNYAYETMINSMSGDGLTFDEIKRTVNAARIIAEKAGIYGMVGGQTLDVYLTGSPMNEEQMDFIFRLKTGALIEASFIAGGILAGVSDNTIEKLEKAGRLVGVAFQIQDDILDVTSTTEILGKPVLSDEKNNKTTYVTLYGMEKAKADVKAFSGQAVELLKETGDNEFLIELVKYLIHRSK